MANNTTDLPTQHDLNDQPTHDIGTYQQYNTVNSIDNPQEHDLEFCTDTAISWFFLQDLSGEHGPVAQLQEHLKHWDGYWQRSGYMRDLIRLLCDVFFLGQSQHIKFLWKKPTIGKRRVLGLCEFESDASVTISIDPKDCHVEMCVADHKSSLLGTLLHELCHAFFAVWHCIKDEGDTQYHRKARTMVGSTGHGIAWSMMACHVEVAARRYLPHLDIRLGIATSLYIEREAGGVVPDEDNYVALTARLTMPQFVDLFCTYDSPRWGFLFSKALSTREAR